MLLIVAAVGAASEALAQQPSQAQVNAIRQSCRNDYMAHCSSVTPGGPAALRLLAAARVEPFSALPAGGECVSRRRLRPPARPKRRPYKATDGGRRLPAGETAALPQRLPRPRRPAAAQSKKAQLAAVGRACGADYRTHCHGIRARHWRGGRLSEAQRGDVVAGVPARAGRRRRREVKIGGGARGCTSGGAAAAPAAAPAPAGRRRCSLRRARKCSSCARPVVATTSDSVAGFVSARPGRIMSALQRGQSVAALPGGALRAARRPLRRSLTSIVAATSVAAAAFMFIQFAASEDKGAAFSCRSQLKMRELPVVRSFIAQISNKIF